MTSNLHTSEAWVRAQSEYIKDLNEEEQQRYFKASPESLLDDASVAEKSHGTESTTRRVLEKLQPFVAAIEQYSEALGVYSSTYPLALGPIWGSIKVLLHIAREFGKYFDKLVDMFTRIDDVLPRFRTYERLFASHERLIHALSAAYLDIITFCTNAKAVFRRGSKTTWKLTFKLLWKPFDQQFGNQLIAFREHRKSVEKEAGLANMIEAADARAMVLADQRQLEKRRREDNRLQIIAMLHAVDYEAKHRKLQNVREAGTGEWLFRQAAYVEWKTPENSAFLCCRGIPGCGKSVLASNLVDHLRGTVPALADPASDVIYYYCDYADQRTLQLDRILGSLLKQLFLNHSLPDHIESQLLQTYARGTRLPPENALSNIFCSSVLLHPDICVVFDGLDDCEKTVWQAMLRIFEQLAPTGHSNVKIFMTCVEEGPVAHHLNNFPCVQVSPVVTAEDIGAFITSSVRSKIESGDLRIRNPKLEKDIISELVLKANGMFLWVFFQIEDLCDTSSDAMIRETLNGLPKGLGDTYRRILIKISKSPSRANLARKVFQWATVAKRPLHVEELKEAVAFGLEDKCWNDDRIPHEDSMFESCRGLIIKDDDDGTAHFAHHTVRQYLTGGLTTKVDPPFEISVVNADILAGHTCVAYLSFSDFETQITSTTPTPTLEQEGILESGGPLWIPSVLGIRRPWIKIPYKLLRGDLPVRSSNPDYLKQLRSKLKPKGSPPTDLKDKYRLLCYAIDYWEPHTRLDQTSNFDIGRRLEDLAKHKKMVFDFRPWGPNQHFGRYGCVGCPNNSRDLVAKDLPYMSMIHYAAEVGNLRLLKLFTSTLTKTGKPDELDDYLHHERHHDRTLLVACSNGRPEIVEYLIESSNYNPADGRAVNAAAAAGHVEVVEYLLSLGQYSIKKQGDAALHSAVENGHAAVVDILAEVGADFNSIDGRTGRSLLESAAMNGHDSVIRVLLKRGARRYTSFHGVTRDVSITHDIETSLIHLAAANGHTAATRVLLESGFVDEAHSSGQTALHSAARLGHSAVVDVLLEKGANPWSIMLGTGQSLYDIQTFDLEGLGYTPLQLAAQGGHVEVLKIFKRYVDRTIPKHYRTKETLIHFETIFEVETVLHCAAAGGHEKATRWLVENGADVNAATSNGVKPLYCAIKSENETTVRVLLELGAIVVDADRTNSEFSPLNLAARLEDNAILKILLESIRKDRRTLRVLRRGFIVKALDSTRDADAESVVSIRLLERELKLFYQAPREDNFECLNDEDPESSW